ncbi:hypothetical protein [Lactococcus allomyrinae]|nr:hypothetical protein [Lactococcus allomyrinae]
MVSARSGLRGAQRLRVRLGALPFALAALAAKQKDSERSNEVA